MSNEHVLGVYMCHMYNVRTQNCNGNDLVWVPLEHPLVLVGDVCSAFLTRSKCYNRDSCGSVDFYSASQYTSKHSYGAYTR